MYIDLNPTIHTKAYRQFLWRQKVFKKILAKPYINNEDFELISKWYVRYFQTSFKSKKYNYNEIKRIYIGSLVYHGNKQRCIRITFTDGLDKPLNREFVCGRNRNVKRTSRALIAYFFEKYNTEMSEIYNDMKCKSSYPNMKSWFINRFDYQLLNTRDSYEEKDRLLLKYWKKHCSNH